MGNSIINKCYDLIETGAMIEEEFITESILLNHAISTMSDESKTNFMNRLMALEKKAFPDD
jgi:hypothetical protein